MDAVLCLEKKGGLQQVADPEVLHCTGTIVSRQVHTGSHAKTCCIIVVDHKDSKPPEGSRSV